MSRVLEGGEGLIRAGRSERSSVNCDLGEELLLLLLLGVCAGEGSEIVWTAICSDCCESESTWGVMCDWSVEDMVQGVLISSLATWRIRSVW